MNPVIELRGASFRYDGPLILDAVDLSIEKGEFLGVVGPNGGGKTTLLKLVLGLIQPTEGEVLVMGRHPAEGRRAIGYVPQLAIFRRDFPITVEQTVLLGRLGIAPRIGGYRRRDRDAARRAMAETEVLDFRNRTLAELSGGELQRVLIARALVSEPGILLLDEPTANVDPRIEMDIFELLKDINRRATIVVVSHDIGFISRYVTRVACLNRTLICHTTSEITGKVIEQLYGRPVRMVRHDSAEGGGNE
jgi:zinc transport system ATP-binding protein